MADSLDKRAREYAAGIFTECLRHAFTAGYRACAEDVKRSIDWFRSVTKNEAHEDAATLIGEYLSEALISAPPARDEQHDAREDE